MAGAALLVLRCEKTIPICRRGFRVSMGQTKSHSLRTRSRRRRTEALLVVRQPGKHRNRTSINASRSPLIRSYRSPALLRKLSNSPRNAVRVVRIGNDCFCLGDSAGPGDVRATEPDYCRSKRSSTGRLGTVNLTQRSFPLRPCAGASASENSLCRWFRVL